jgi:hypothetical protein
MTALLSRERLGSIFWIGLPAVVAVASIAVVIAIPLPPSKVDRLCDDAVHQLLTTQDLVELRRAIFLVRWFNCSISRRLT